MSSRRKRFSRGHTSSEYDGEDSVAPLTLFLHADKNTDELEAKTLLDEYNRTAEQVWNAYTEASWAYNTDISESNKDKMVSLSD